MLRLVPVTCHSGGVLYHQERNHQGLENKIIRPQFNPLPSHGAIKCRRRMGGLLRYYYREAA